MDGVLRVVEKEDMVGGDGVEVSLSWIVIDCRDIECD